jgi:hypothetical protein
MRLLSQIRKTFGVIDKYSFYEGKSFVTVEWWISYCSEFPDRYWARLRVLSDGCADAAFDETNVYGFDNRESASTFLGEDEYIRFDSMDEEREAEIGAKKADIFPPAWSDHEGLKFEYLGTY